MDVVGHYDKLMKQISGTAVVVESINEKACPRFSSKKGAPAPSFGGDHVCLSVIGRMFSFGSHRQPSGAKAPFFFMRLCGAPEGAPLQPSGALRWLPARPFKAQVQQTPCPQCKGWTDYRDSSVHPFHSSIIFTKSLNK